MVNCCAFNSHDFMTLGTMHLDGLAHVCQILAFLVQHPASCKMYHRLNTWELEAVPSSTWTHGHLEMYAQSVRILHSGYTSLNTHSCLRPHAFSTNVPFSTFRYSVQLPHISAYQQFWQAAGSGVGYCTCDSQAPKNHPCACSLIRSSRCWPFSSLTGIIISGRQTCLEKYNNPQSGNCEIICLVEVHSPFPPIVIL